MTRSLCRTSLCLLAWLPAAAQEAAEPTAAPLTLEAVLESSNRHFPGILESLAARRAAEAAQLEAGGAFDLVFESEGFSRLDGFYDGTALEVTAKRPLRPLGASLYAGYRLSDGRFPVYEDVNFTNTGGALKAGVMFSLLRDRDVDERRVGELTANLELREAELELLMTRVGVQ